MINNAYGCDLKVNARKIIRYTQVLATVSHCVSHIGIFIIFLKLQIQIIKINKAIIEK